MFNPIEKFHMKKTLIALAALAATSAFAQVTVYGRLDTGFSQNVTSVKTAGVTVDTKDNGVTTSNQSSSRWGIKGTEDLGGGMKANFVLESALNSDNGAAQAKHWGRASTVGISGSFGSIRLGFAETPLYLVTAAGDVFGQIGASASQLFPDSKRASDAIFYDYATNGFSLGLLYGDNDSGTTATPATSATTGASVAYASGPLYVGLGWGAINTQAGAVSAKNDGYGLSASYDFGAAKLFGQFIQGKAQANTSLDTYTVNTETNLGVSVPVGAVTLMAGLGRNTRSQTTTGAELATNTGSGNDVILGATYSLSKRSTVYLKTGTYDQFSFGGNSGTGKATASIGLLHAF